MFSKMKKAFRMSPHGVPLTGASPSGHVKRSGGKPERSFRALWQHLSKPEQHLELSGGGAPAETRATLSSGLATLGQERHMAPVMQIPPFS